MNYGHESTKRTNRKISTFNDTHRPSHRADHSQNPEIPDYLPDPWANRVKRSKFEPSQSKLEIEKLNFILRGGKTTKIKSIDSPHLGYVRSKSQYGGNGFDSRDNILI